MNLPTADSLKAKISSDVHDLDLVQWVEDIKSSLSKAYAVV